MKHLLAIAFLCGFTTAQAGSYAYQQGESMQFGWLSSDMFTFFSASNTVMKVSTKSVDNINSHNSAIWMKGWAFASDATFYSFYPYDIQHRIDNTPYSSIPVSFTNQIQTSNRSTEHLASYDYMTAQGTSTSDALSLNFTHLGCIMRIAAYIPEGKTYTSLSLTTKDNTSWFATEATVNATNNTMTTTATASTATLSLSDVAVATDDYLTAYIMMAPADLTGKTMALTLTASDGSVLQAYISGCNMQQGRVYSITLGMDNYFRLQPASYQGDAISQNYQQSLTEGFDEPTDNQITEVSAYAPDFMADTENQMTAALVGDVNGDGVVDNNDAEIVMAHYQSGTTDELDPNQCDVNGDGVIDVTDAQWMLTPATEKDITWRSTTNKLVVSDVEFETESTETQYVNLSLVGTTRYAAYNVDIEIPEGVELVEVLKASDLLTQHTFRDTYDEATRSLRLSCISADGAELKSDAGLLCQIGLKLADGTEAGTLSMKLTGINLTKADAEKHIPADITYDNITVKESEPSAVTTVTEEGAKKAETFCIDGVRVMAPARDVIYIQDGKKIIR